MQVQGPAPVRGHHATFPSPGPIRNGTETVHVHLVWVPRPLGKIGRRSKFTRVSVPETNMHPRQQRILHVPHQVTLSSLAPSAWQQLLHSSSKASKLNCFSSRQELHSRLEEYPSSKQEPPSPNMGAAVRDNSTRSAETQRTTDTFWADAIFQWRHF